MFAIYQLNTDLMKTLQSTCSSSTLKCFSFRQICKVQLVIKSTRQWHYSLFPPPPPHPRTLFTCVGDGRWPRLQTYVSNQNWRLGPGDRSAIPHRPSDRRAVGSQSLGLWGSHWLWTHIHIHDRGRGHRGNHASWTSLCHCQNHGGCVFISQFVYVSTRTSEVSVSLGNSVSFQLKGRVLWCEGHVGKHHGEDSWKLTAQQTMQDFSLWNPSFVCP